MTPATGMGPPARVSSKRQYRPYRYMFVSLSLGETYPEKRGNFFKQNQHDSLPPSTAMVEKIDAVDYHTHDAEPGSDSDDNND